MRTRYDPDEEAKLHAELNDLRAKLAKMTQLACERRDTLVAAGERRSKEIEIHKAKLAAAEAENKRLLQWSLDALHKTDKEETK